MDRVMHLPRNFGVSLLMTFVVIFLIILGFVYREVLIAKMNEWKILPQPEHLTELYVNNYLDFPKQVARGQTVSFSFTIHNLEGAITTYPYVVYLQTTDGTRISVADTNVTLADGESRTIKESYTFKTNSAPVTVFIKLPTVNQSLHFALPTRI